MRLLLDMGLPRRSAEALRRLGHDAAHLSERGLSRLPDEEIVALAVEEDRVVITLDADFSALLALSGAARPSVVHLRIEGLGYTEATRVVAAIVETVEDDLAAGCIASVTLSGIRIRHLPVH
ncbi:MAG: DUF5615 family PIN-like protein [Armatimonadetes bacterium]|nr:DUF5615 family PIN-like protein [Armatimonadota bacterium]